MLSDAWPLVSPIVIAVVGSFVAFRLQQRQWLIRREIEVREKRYEAARGLYDDISRLLDRRLYATGQLLVWIKRNDLQRREEAMSIYREVLADWNNNLNRYRAMLHVFFGERVRDHYQDQVGEKLINVGAEVEQLYRGGEVSNLNNIEANLKAVYSDVYSFNLTILSSILEMETRAGLRLDYPQLTRRSGNVPSDVKFIEVEGDSINS